MSAQPNSARRTDEFQSLQSALTNFIEKHNATSVCLVRGNAGDALINCALEHFIRESGLNLRLIESQEIVGLKSRGASGFILNAAGNLTRNFKAGWQSLALARQEGINVFVLPCSLDPTDEQWQSFRRGDVIVCREGKTFEMASRLPDIETHLSHDLAFYPDVQWWLAQVQDQLADCRDFFRFWRMKQYGRRNAFSAWFDQVVRGAGISALRNDREKIEMVLPRWNVDVSSWLGPSSLNSWQANRQCAARFLYFLSRFKYVQTNRLHVAIACHALGISCTLFPNSYFKNAEVFKHSLTGVETSVTFAG